MKSRRKRILPWVYSRKKSLSDLPYETPIPLGDVSNGEFYKEQTPKLRKIREEVLRRCDENARRLNMDRREFIASAMGMCTTLAVMNVASGCGNPRGVMHGVLPPSLPSGGNGPGGMGGMPAGFGVAGSGGAGSGGASSGGVAGGPGAGSAAAGMSGGNGGFGMAGHAPDPSTTGGGFCVPEDACMQNEMAVAMLQGSEFILDLQTHHVGEGRNGFVLEDCCIDRMPGGQPLLGGTCAPGTARSGNQCAWPNNYYEQIFLDSDTTVAVLSGIPGRVDVTGQNPDLVAGAFGISNAEMRASSAHLNQMLACGAPRMLNHCQVGPSGSDATWQATQRMMETAQREGHRGWKCYPPAAPEGAPWWVNEQYGMRMIEKARALGDPLICIHKGFPLPGFDREHADPKDIGPAAVMYPDVHFVVYHSAFEDARMEGPFDPNQQAPTGTNRLVKTVVDNNLMGKNVYAEMGSAWLLAIQSGVETAGHYVGKMLKYVGPNRLVWGSECVWFGSPQRQIEAMRTFMMPQALIDKYGYPALTPEVKANIFGLNAAPLYGIDPKACRAALDKNILAMHKNRLDDELGARRWALQPMPVRTRRQFLSIRRAHVREKQLG